MSWAKIFALSLRHIYLIKGSFPRILDLIYWPTIQIFLWGFISKFFTMNSSYFENTVGVILSAAILYDFLFRSSISYNMMFLEEIWSRNFTNLFIAPIKLSEIIAALTFTAIFRTLIGLIPAALLAIPLFGVSIFKIGLPLILLLVTLYLFGVTLGLMVTSGLVRFGPSFENIAWASLFFLAPLGCIYYPIEVLPDWLQLAAKLLPLVYIFEEMRNILIYDIISYYQISKAVVISILYFIFGVILFYLSYAGAKNRGTLINMGE
ncbi:MAG: ABC transporter permease [Pseudomonadota bacterium]|nr:ABC transporter permease [Pseudomonadota bacterium]